MQIAKSNSIQALPILFLIFLFQSLFFLYIDEGYYSFSGLATVEGWLAIALWTSVFTLIGFILFSIFNKIGNLSFLAKILLAAFLAAPTAFALFQLLWLNSRASG